MIELEHSETLTGKGLSHWRFYPYDYPNVWCIYNDNQQKYLISTTIWGKLYKEFRRLVTT